jgi:probable rRNA maturation factor
MSSRRSSPSRARVAGQRAPPAIQVELVGCPRGLAGLARRAVRSSVASEFERTGGRCVGAAGGHVVVAFVEDDEIQRLNERWLNHEGPTDVLTFDLRDDAAGMRMEGQIVASLDTAGREAAARGIEWRHELILYVTHATFHLLGYDDTSASQKRRMHTREDEVLTSLGIGPVYYARARR